MADPDITRRTFIKSTALVLASTTVVESTLGADTPVAGAAGKRQATGVRVGDMTDTAAVVWVRLTQRELRNNDGLRIAAPAHRAKHGQTPEISVPLAQLEGACPGGAGRVRLRYATSADLAGARATEWVEVGEGSDFSHKFELVDLAPATTYHFASETADANADRPREAEFGTFTTAPAADEMRPVRFCVMTCQGYKDRGHADGHAIYPAMAALAPHFTCLTGDLVYYDNDPPAAVTTGLARHHWARMFSLPRLHDFTRQFGCYWQKDDHDTLEDDTWPGQNDSALTFAEGQRIFREQTPVREGSSYRTIRWGRDLQIWMTEGRDFRSPNTDPDGPGKTIWGEEQKAWFKRTVLQSTATWKILVSPTPLVGPDRKNKDDNHSNAGFQHEGDEIRSWLQENVADHFLVICGDRHWQYHSVHPETGLHEFSVGPASDQHAGGSPGYDEAYHRFHRVEGGFLSALIARPGGVPSLQLTLHDVGGTPVYSWSPPPRA